MSSTDKVRTCVSEDAVLQLPKCHALTRGHSWADIPPEERLSASDYNATLNWDEDSGRVDTTATENTAKALKSAFSRPVSNQARLLARKPLPFPNLEATKCCPKLDPVAKQLMQKDQKQADALLARLEMLVLNAMALLVHIVEEAGIGTLSSEAAAEAAKAALSLLGNASANISRERRWKAITSLNKKVYTSSCRGRGDIRRGSASASGKSLCDEDEGQPREPKVPGRHVCPPGEGGPEFSEEPLQPPASGKWQQHSRRGGRTYYGNGNQNRRFQLYNGANWGKENFQRKKNGQSKDTLP
jgi:hypothetical protein